MKAKPIFYSNGYERNFRDHYTISLMTGEPMPKKWQKYIELTPEEKARWDASLKLDEEYRIAEAQGFPYGIPGGRTRGDILYQLTQEEEAEKRKMQEENLRGRFFGPQKTEMRNKYPIVPSYTPINGRGDFLQIDTGIKKEPAIGVKSAIHEVASRFEALCEANDARTKMSIQSRRDDVVNEAMIADANGSLIQTFEENEAYLQTALNQEQVDVSGMTYEDMRNISKQVEAELNQIIENKPAGQYITDYEIYEVLSKYSDVKYKDLRNIRLAVEEKLKNLPMPTFNYRANDSVYERSVMQGEGAFLSPNWDLIEKYLENKKSELEKDLDQTVLDFFGSIDTILAMCPQDSRLAKLGARLGYLLLAVAALRCVLDVQRRREKLINDLVTQGRKRREAEAETLPIYHKWLLEEITTLVLEDWASDVLPLIFIPQEDEENKGSSII